jgi:hypothetical protein
MAEVGFPAFAVGDIDPNRDYVHVFDDVTLELLLTELDTITDFVGYLNQKEWFLRSGHLGNAAGEEELLGHYLTHTNGDDEHGFFSPSGAEQWEPNELLCLGEGIWDHVQSHPDFLAKKSADRISYGWDSMIEDFAQYLPEGQVAYDPPEENFIFGEPALRYMALESRLSRRFLAEQIKNAVGVAAADRTYARIIGPPLKRGTGVWYVFLQFPFIPANGAPDYEKYQRRRALMMYAYALILKCDHREVPRIIAIGMEPPRWARDQLVSSDLGLLEIDVWTVEHENEATELRNAFGIMNPARMRAGTFGGSEYPESSET